MPTLDDARKSRRLSLLDQVPSVGTILSEEFGTPFRFFRADDGHELASIAVPDRSDGADRPGEETGWVLDFGKVEQSGVFPLRGGGYRLAVSLHEGGRPALVALGLKTSVARPELDAVREETSRLEKWLRSVFDRLRLASQTECHHRAEPAKPAVAADAWEVIVRLEQLMRVQKTHKDPVKNRRRVLRSVAELVPVQSLVFVPLSAAERVVSVGEGLLSSWDCGQLGASLGRSVDWQEAGYLIRNDLAKSSWAACFPSVANLLALPVLAGIPVGWLIAINKTAGPTTTSAAHHDHEDPGAANPAPAKSGKSLIVPFRRTDAAMLAPFASLLGYHARAFQSYSHLRELLVGLTRSLTAAIDAKDSYTYGHSERVARIAVELGRELGLPEEELSDIYLAGLLHDIGKIGIRDQVLGKRAPLDEEEFEHVKEHVTIGYRILSGLTAIAHLLPGVLYHHERYDGQGYPEGLKGSAIPFIARILAVADSYDAMSTSRPYRVALACERVEQNLVAGAGSQWDQAVIDAFVRCKARINEIRQRGVGESLCGALEDALSKGAGRQAQSSMVMNMLNR
jgi:HD-GYP domain-containing protein (c-di-GMP phosphodiesterase class II)